MFINEILENGGITTSFEVFPPKNNAPFEPVLKSVEKLSLLKPDFISVTYGAGGGTSQNTPKIASYIQHELHTPSMAHLTCASSTKEEIDAILSQLRDIGVDNILALRGDLPEDYNPDDSNYYRYASQLVERILDFGGFSVGAACYPEGHVESKNAHEDLIHLKEKVDCGAQYLVTQKIGRAHV